MSLNGGWKPKRLNPSHRAMARLFSLGLKRKQVASIVDRCPQLLTILRSNSPEFNLKVNEILARIEDGVIDNRVKVEKELSNLSVEAALEAGALLHHPEPKIRFGSVWQILDRTGHAAPSRTSIQQNVQSTLIINQNQLDLISQTIKDIKPIEDKAQDLGGLPEPTNVESKAACLAEPQTGCYPS